MSTRSKSRKSKSRIPLDPYVGDVSEELEAPISSEIVFKKVWKINKFEKTISLREHVDSPKFRCSVNGITTYWNMAIRFWKGPNGKKITNPIVLCLNLVGCKTEKTGQAQVRFQLGAWNARIKTWERCSMSTVIINLENMNEMHSIGYETFKISDHHINSASDVRLMVKIQVIHSDEEKHSLSQDLTRILSLESQDLTDTIVQCEDNDGIKTFKAHSFLIKARSPLLGLNLTKYTDEFKKNINYKLDLRELNYNTAQELFRYIYSDKVDNTELYANKLLPLSTKFNLSGLTTLCERALIESFTPNNVANILILADQYGCENLRRAALHYCEESEEIRNNVQIGTTLAWKVMEMVNPNLFQEACENLGSSSSNLDSLFTTGSNSDF